MEPLPARFGRHLAAAVETADLPQNLRDVLRVIALALAEGETGPMEELAGAIGKGRAEAQHLLSENSRAFEAVRGALWQILDATSPAYRWSTPAWPTI